jgi:hypothetical protein
MAQSQQAWIPIMKWSGSSFTCPGGQELESLKERADEGDATAQETLGAYYLSICHGEHNYGKAMEYLVQSAMQGNAYAQLRLGEAYHLGTGVTKNMTAAIAWFEKAAAQGSSRAMNDLGVAYSGGEGGPKDEARAAKYFQSAVDLGLREAVYNLAAMYDQGHGVTQDYQLARKWYQQSSDRYKDHDAEYRLAMLMEEGLGGSKDTAAANAMFQLAAKHGSEDAQLKLELKTPSQMRSVSSGFIQYQVAISMLKGNDRDPAKAITFLERSSEAGYPQAFVALADMYSNGKDVPRDEARAVSYLEKAIARDPKFDVPYNNLAWLWVTSEDLKLRNPQKAVEYATKSIELADGKKPYAFDTLAHAYFLLGDVDKAMETEAKAMTIDPKDDYYKKTLDEFKTAKEHSSASK